MDYHGLKKLLIERKNESKGKRYVWLEKEIMESGLNAGVIQLIELNVDQGDETYKTVGKFEEREFVFVGGAISI